MNMPITHPYLQFRFWCQAARCHVSDYTYSGKVEELFQGEDVLLAEQCTGLTDQLGNFVYENDLVSIQADDKMPAWEGGLPVGDDLIKSLNGTVVTFKVERDPGVPSNLFLSARSKGGLEIMAPVSWVRKGRIVGRALD